MRGLNGRLDGSAPRDEGMTLIEIIVALGLLAVMSAAVLAVLGTAIKATGEDRSRLEAVSLASRELEITRDAFSSATRGPDTITQNAVVNQNPLPDGTMVVDDVPYTVTRTARWEQIGAADAQLSPCDQGSSEELVVLHVTVDVTWPALGDRPPVSMDTIMTPAKGTYSSLDGHIGLQVIDSEGGPKAGVTVTAKDGGDTRSGVTASDGCVLLAHLPAGHYTVTAQVPGFVNRSGDPQATKEVDLQAGQLWRGSVEYDAAAGIIAEIRTPQEGYTIPAGVESLPLTLGNSHLQPVGVKTVPGSGLTRTLEDLWPDPAGYGLWLGGCEDDNPAVTGDSLPVPTPRGTTSGPVAVTLGAVEIDGEPGTSVSATHAADRLCEETTIPLGTLQADPTGDPTGGATADPTTGPTDEPSTTPAPGGVLRVALPYGLWTISGQQVRVGPGEAKVIQL